MTYTSGSVVRTTYTYWPNGWVLKIPPTASVSSRTAVKGSTFNKSELRTSVADSFGWRDPLPYALSTTDFSDWRGVFKVWGTLTGNSHPLIAYEPYQSGAHIRQFDRTVPLVPLHWHHRAEVEAYNKLKDLNVNYATALAEARRSLGLIGGSLATLYDAYKNAKRGRWQKAAKTLGVPNSPYRAQKGFSSKWLSLQYGWLPLLSDIHGAYTDASDRLYRYEERISVTRVIKAPIPIPAPQSVTLGGFTPVYPKYKHKKGSVYGVKVRLDYTVTHPALSSLSRVGFVNPVEVAWELVPFSFVIDWLAPIGNWVSAFDADFGLTWKGGSKTVFYRLSRTGKASYASPRRAFNQVVELDVEGKYDHFSMNRTVYSSPPMAIPYIKNPVSGKHVANAIALLSQLMFRGH